MATTTTIPVTIVPEAAARIAQLGFQGQFQQMVEHAKETVPGLRAIKVVLEYDPCEPGRATMILISFRHDQGPGDDPTDWQWITWFSRTFPADVCQHFVMISSYEEPDAR